MNIKLRKCAGAYYDKYDNFMVTKTGKGYEVAEWSRKTRSFQPIFSAKSIKDAEEKIFCHVHNIAVQQGATL